MCSNILSYRVPTTEAEAVQTMKDMAQDWDGGFHPDDDPREIVNMRSGERVFPTEQEAVHYDRVMGACRELITDIYEVALDLLMAT